MMIERLLTVNDYSRPGRSLGEVLGVVLHWTANPNAGAVATRNYFEAKKTGTGGYGSAHYVVGQEGEVVRCIPECEVAYHCGTDRPDPKSGLVYTEDARRRFGHYATNYRTESPNMCTIGVELCPDDWSGSFSGKTLRAAAELCAGILIRHNLGTDALTTHGAVVGWKDCPKLWVHNPALFGSFVLDVASWMGKLRGCE